LPSELERQTGAEIAFAEAPDNDVPAELLSALVEDAPSVSLRAVKVRGACVVGPLAWIHRFSRRLAAVKGS